MFSPFLFNVVVNLLGFSLSFCYLFLFRLAGLFVYLWFPHIFFHAINSAQFSCSVVSDSLRPHEPQHTRPPCPSPTPRVYPNSCPLSRWCHPSISSSVVPFSSCRQSFAASGSFAMSRLITSSSQSIGASVSVLPMNIQG